MSRSYKTWAGDHESVWIPARDEYSRMRVNDEGNHVMRCAVCDRLRPDSFPSCSPDAGHCVFGPDDICPFHH